MQDVQLVLEKDGMSLGYTVPGAVCDKCGEQLIDRDTVRRLEA